MESEPVINQVLEEIKQSIILINESLGSEKYDISSLSNLSLSTILDICDVRIVDELPPIQTRTEDLLVIPYENSQENLSISQIHNRSSSYIIVTSPNPVSTQNEAIGGASWTYYDDCESTSEGSFLTEDEDDDGTSDSEVDMSDLDRSFKNSSGINLEKSDDLLHKGGNCNSFIEKFGRNHLNDSSNNEHFKEVFPISFRSNIPLICESFVDNQENSMSIPIDSTNILKRQLVKEINEEERNFKMVKYDSQLPIGRDQVFY
ncbi:hypothetical protein [Cryptosporidium parvum Iowa II]|uniref:Uncharacterized protein n=2 Tax=Cryptosporidium parvum TaxID=5807 RepID=Q5CX21_CRYPI|nr:hypothetical protein [Cryptosporidium parvum Iowa II]QOY41169.1 Uncharacterized protein CPATCC_0014410 [Cryptosporidium parvum]WKS78396.1 hypothetical protein CPCDC_6g2850 [Cryptosporidium sp. 43IA8]EAK89917.1 hypothetical protein cgd6_2850 [Cryptosporidium parvum Iowa II]WRK32889.1 Uncharacterized protein cpbgf_6002850 [Cryptosporidium parvum]CAD98574.1 hypothetical predicted protein, unknown function [Cryptosporidium parvum]|eukprot:QOY41169.1 hypothetical protein CPATCC_002824 [Cryptosporidium parvum]